MKITVRQAIKLYDSVAKMKDAGVSVKGLRNIDLAMNKSKIAHIVEGYDKAQEPPAGYQKYSEKVNDLRMKETVTDGGGAHIGNTQRFAVKLDELKTKYAAELSEYEEWQKDLKTLPDKEYDIELIEIPREELKFAEDNGGAAEIVYGLLPCIMGNK